MAAGSKKIVEFTEKEQVYRKYTQYMFFHHERWNYHDTHLNFCKINDCSCHNPQLQSIVTNELVGLHIFPICPANAMIVGSNIDSVR